MRGCHPPFGGHRRHGHRAPWEEDAAGRPSPSRLYRNLDKAMIKGVCAGVADYFGVAPWLVRLGVLILFFSFTIPTVIVYFVLVNAVPPRPAGLYATSEEEAFWTRVRLQPAGMVSSLRRQFRDMEKRLRDVETFVTSREFRLDREIKDL